MQTERKRVFTLFAERSLSYAKIIQASAMKTCFQIAERSLSYAKIIQASAMETCFQIAERSFILCKDTNFAGSIHLFKLSFLPFVSA